MPKRLIQNNVFDEALERLRIIYAEGHRLVVSFSAGKDSTCVLEVAIAAAKQTGRLPVEVVMRDEEIMFPGTYEFAERTAKRKEVKFHWYYANQAIANAYSRKAPFFWVFDPALKPERWVRTPPEFSQRIAEKNIDYLVMPSRFPPAPGKKLINVIGLRVQESLSRRFGIFSSGGYLSGANDFGVYKARPIYDWRDDDVWKAIADNKWDYNEAYNVMAKMKVRKLDLRITPPTLIRTNASNMIMASKAWPRWFDRVCNRLEGVRSVVTFGRSYLEPKRKFKETWQQTFKRECVSNAPSWIAERSQIAADHILAIHRTHAGHDLPESVSCHLCNKGSTDLGSWKALVLFMYDGDPFSIKTRGILDPVDPLDFRPTDVDFNIGDFYG